MIENLARRICVVDFEASCLPGGGRRSYPIEVAAGVPETKEVRSWLIRPELTWLDAWDWHAEAEQLHRLTPEYLLAHGLPRAQVARELQAFIGDREVVSDNPAAEGWWLAVLFSEERPRSVGWLSLLYEAITAGSKTGHDAYRRAEIYAYRVAPPTHRAGDDVRHELLKLRELLRLIDEAGEAT